ncbi:SIS domain-containing protein [Streptomyces spiramenti]|uniref:SIS domain-containing protein n=1 Tax=Streptomyces spiramenti TaxID=2720606 RepID=A0ABX1APZ2_9ACTN|nr:SIS domain-containing protein [Streptomyces spiramenti]NJP68365.1 SIS domain-containing protein [Streptomyces spiramenti]
MSPLPLADQFFDAAQRLLARVREEEGEAVARAASLLADTVASGGRVFAYGAGHSALPAQDVVYRAGGLAVVNLLSVPGASGVDVQPAPLASALERVGGLAQATLATSPARAGDLLFVISLSGRNVLPVEMAAQARALGMRVVGVTSVRYAAETTSKTPDGSFLKDHCDVVLDNKIAPGDAELTHPGVAAPFGPASTVVTSALMQAVVATAAGELADRGQEPPLLRSGNIDGGTEWNQRVCERHAEQVLWQRR